MGSVGDAYDNAMCESFFATLECELLDRRRFATQVEARLAVFDFLEGWYNPHRRHSALDYESPLRYECDNGQEFPFEFALAVEAAGIRHRYIRPRRPQQNGKVERSHRIDHEEFWSRQNFPDFDAAAAGLRSWEATYNYERLSLALKGRTPAEKLAATLSPEAA